MLTTKILEILCDFTKHATLEAIIFPNSFNLIDKNKVDSLIMPVNVYIGGNEHAILHLLYSRFIYRALMDFKLIPESKFRDPFYQILAQGMVKASTFLDKNGRFYSPNEGQHKNDTHFY